VQPPTFELENEFLSTPAKGTIRRVACHKIDPH
jgi:hypothetical protein